MGYDLVGFSRAGDVFHYRWAARRSLKMIYPNSLLNSITIEGSPDDDKAGEYVIDLTESYRKPDDDEQQQIKYYQLKHTTVKEDTPFVLSDLKTTFEGFAKRYTQHAGKDEVKSKDISFTIVTNRKIEDNFKNGIASIANGKTVNATFKKTILKYTELDSVQLKEFCSIINFEDGEGNYNDQKNELKIEMSQLIAGTFDNAYVDSIITLMQDKVLPDSNGLIVKEDILNRIAVTSEKAMFPADAIWENVEKTIIRVQHATLIDKILSADAPIIIHAEGGVGKSVFARQVLNSLIEESVVIAYDCFGAGGYRNRSTTRHMHRTGLVQIANELAAKGLCLPLLVQSTTHDSEVMQEFLLRIGSATSGLKKANENAALVLIIDAADNAEMAANEFNETCFAHELIREELPEGCKIVFLCRTERINLLQPLGNTAKYELEGFSAEESLENLKNYFPDAKEQDGTEFHRLTNGNPRVQANALDFKTDSLAELLANLGPGGTKIEDQIELQLSRAVTRIEDMYPSGFKNHVKSICFGLASLSPHIPLDVLARAADVEIAAVKSFVADIGRPLWISDLSVQFRDEPTETWFRKKFCASTTDFQNYITSLEPLAAESTYVSLVLPQLYLQAEQYDKLILIALSDDFLPKDNPIDARNVRVYRLQFAFKAALKLHRFKDSIQLAVRAGEEMAGEQRQLLLLRENVDLLVALQDQEKIKELAFKRSITGSWAGSENVYSSALLSAIEGYKGEARGFLRSAMNWLNAYFEQSKARRKKRRRYDEDEEKLTDQDILELANSHLNINGVEGLKNFITHLTPHSAVFNTMSSLSARLIDKGDFELLTKILEQLSDYPYYVVAITSQLGLVGKVPDRTLIEKCLNVLSVERTRIKIDINRHNDPIPPAILAFLEACLQNNLPEKKIFKILNYYFQERASRMVHNSHFSDDRELYLRALAIRLYVTKMDDVDIERLMPIDLLEGEKKDRPNDEIKEFDFIINGLLPLYQARLTILKNQPSDVLSYFKEAVQKSNVGLQGRYRSSDNLPSEIAAIYISILKWSSNCSKEDLLEFYESFIKNNSAIRVHEKIKLVRSTYRLPHLRVFAPDLEQAAFTSIKSKNEDRPEELSDLYISLTRSVLSVSPDDASVYFENAIEIASKFGDEIYQRWEAIQAIAKRSVSTKDAFPELAYRFIRIAELVGENLREKHWDRGEAIQVCTRLCTSSGIAALSRWREREIGRFEWLESALIQELLKSEKIDIKTAICLTTFLNIDQIRDGILRLLAGSFSSDDKALLVNQLLPRIQKEGAPQQYWTSLNEALQCAGVQNEHLDKITNSFSTEEKSRESNDGLVQLERVQKAFDWEVIFADCDLSTSQGISSVLDKFELKIANRDPWMPKTEFWKNVLNRIDERGIYVFFDNLLLVRNISLYDLEGIFQTIQSEWKSKASFNKKITALSYSIGQKFAHELIITWQYKSTIERLALDETQISALRSGIFDGLSAGNEFANAEMLFGFAVISSSELTQEEAVHLLNFVIARFELHVEDDFGDGLPDQTHTEELDVFGSVAGFIWSSLASPQSEIRWKAAHCVRQLIYNDCNEIIDQLFCWFERGNIGQFGVSRYPFYDLHAKLYFFIALSRASFDKTSNIEKHASILKYYALNEIHILIQKFASDTLLNIIINKPEVCTEAEIALLSMITKSKFPIESVDYQYRRDSYLHATGKPIKKSKFYFGYDFDQYWFKPLGEVFAISGQQVEELAANVVQERWGTIKGGYDDDPRVGLWNRSREYATDYYKSSYPRTDRLNFYISYHSMMVVAAQLLKSMPTVIRREYSEDDWNEWLERHLLTRTDGKWISDFRDPIPIVRPEWVKNNYKDDSQLAITDGEFLDAILEQRNGETWLNVAGYWQESNDTIKGTYYISTALVSPTSSEALLNALSTCIDCHDYKLPFYKERRMEFKTKPFVLKGWIQGVDLSKRLDEYDPFAGEIRIPPYNIGKKIIKKLGLSVSEDGKNFWENASNEPSIINLIYAAYNSSREDEAQQSGNRLIAHLPFLIRLCNEYKSELIFKVQLERNQVYRRYRDGHKHRETETKIFILSPDGKIRSISESHQLG